MSDKAFMVAFLYMVISFLLGIAVGRFIRWGRTGTTKYTEDD